MRGTRKLLDSQNHKILQVSKNSYLSLKMRFLLRIILNNEGCENRESHVCDCLGKINIL